MTDLVSTQTIQTLEAAQQEQFLKAGNASHFPSETSTGLLFEQHSHLISQIVAETKPIELSVFALEHISDYYLYYAHYLLTKDAPAKLSDALAKAAKYGYLAIKVARGYQACFEKNVLMTQQSIVKYWSLVTLCGWWPEMREIGEIVYRQVTVEEEDFKGFIVADNEGISSHLWFILSQYSYVIDKPLDQEDYMLASFLYPYEEVLKIRDTTDTATVDRWVDILCDVHLEYTEEGDVFSSLTSQLFPYEILTWLAIRQRKGLENPEKYEHLLMQQLLVSIFEKPLAKPECAEADRLLDKLSEVFGK